jgi:hypothetical protein
MGGVGHTLWCRIGVMGRRERGTCRSETNLSFWLTYLDFKMECVRSSDDGPNVELQF